VKTTPLDWQRIAAESGAKVVYHAETGSTNDDARELALAGAEHGTVVFADAQRQGRGRRGTPWISPARRNLLCSVVLRPDLPVEKWSRLTHACALAVSKALERIPDLPGPEIKWPNDIYLSGRKVSGILLESAAGEEGGFAVAGIGVNLNLTRDDLPNELRSIATSVWLERGGQPASREDFAVHVLQHLAVECRRAHANFDAIRAECAARSFLNGKRVRLLSGGQVREGIADGSGPEGELRLVTDDGRRELVSSADFVRLTMEPDRRVT
jgi:BirA family transcriptional regulator, biotin operon repressor / biotin---[acetyl-CoA-carboxylase] ligase